MQARDIVIINITGTHGISKATKTINKRFSGLGVAIGDNGEPNGTPDRLRNLPTGEVQLPPEFPAADFTAAQLAGDVTKMRAIQSAYGERLAAWERSAKGGNESVKIAKSVIEYAKEFHDFSDRDREDRYNLKLENVDVTSSKLGDGRTLYTVAGTAVFGQ